MKKLIVCLLALLCLLSACAARNLPLTEDLDERIRSAVDLPFVRADEDFGQTNFNGLAGVSSWRVYLSEANDGIEYGFFVMEDAADTIRMETQIKNYIKAESEQVKTLAALYPAEELEARLARYEKATIGSKGKLVYYIVADRPISEKIRNVIRKDA